MPEAGSGNKGIGGETVKQDVVCLNYIDGKLRSVKIEKRTIYHRSVAPRFGESLDFVVSMGKKYPVYFTNLGTPVYEKEIKSIGKEV